jgi:hypothetical protein
VRQGSSASACGPDYWKACLRLSSRNHRAKWATLGLSVLNVTDEDTPASRQEFGYDPRIGNPLGRQFEVTLRKEF